jgi:hypothetical protein
MSKTEETKLRETIENYTNLVEQTLMAWVRNGGQIGAWIEFPCPFSRQITTQIANVLVFDGYGIDTSCPEGRILVQAQDCEKVPGSFPLDIRPIANFISS